MTGSNPEQPSQPFGGVEYPSLESSPPTPDPYAAVNYPPDAGLPPPIYPPPGYAGSPAYYPTYDPYRPMKPPGTNGKAIASLVASAIGITCCGLTSIVGVILGFIAMRETRSTGQDGHGLALAGTIIGGLATAGWVVYILLYVALIASGWSLV